MGKNLMHTYRLNKGTDVLLLTSAAFGLQIESGIKGYLRLPLTAPEGDLTTDCWRILLELTGKNRGLLPFEIAADVVIGRGMEGADAPDLDLTALDALDLGVSRRHALLRPTTNNLYLIDLGSTNGTLINGSVLGRGAHSLALHDHISLGKLNMRVRYLEVIRGQTPALAPEEIPPTPLTSPPSPPAGPPTHRLLSDDEESEEPESPQATVP